MALENILRGVKTTGKVFLTTLLAATALNFASCEKKGANSGNNGGNHGSPPETPDFYQIAPIVQEPIRGMYLTIYDASDNEDGFVIERKTQGERFTRLANLSKNTETYDDWGLNINTDYTYRIKAHNEFGSSDWSEEETQTSAGPEPGTVFIYPQADAYVDEDRPSKNLGNDGYLLVTNKSSKRQRAYLKFPYNNIPSHAIDIDNAELRLICQNESTLGATLVSVGDLANDWNESSVTWNNKPFGRGITTDAQYVYNDGQPAYWDITPIVRRWSEGTTLNHGLELFNSSNNLAVLFSRERNNLGPLLTIKYLW